MTTQREFAGDHDFALGDVRGLRLWVPVLKDTEVHLKSVFRSYLWTPGINTAECSPRDTHNKLGKPFMLRTPECMNDHVHNTVETSYKVDDPACHREHTPGMDPAHICGFYAYTATADNPYLKSYVLHVEGVIQGFGRTLIGTKGFRCGKARILALVLPHHVPDGYLDEAPGYVERLHEICDEGVRATYPGVPIFSTREAMLREFPLTHPDL